MPPSDLPPVAVVLINWNALEDTAECIDSLGRLEYGNLRVIVVDNGSRGEQAAALRQRFPHVHVHAAGRNLGYTGGNNAGLRLALDGGAAYILCLNNDTVAAPDALRKLVEALEANPHVGLATAAIYEAHQPTTLAGMGCRLRFDMLVCGEQVRQSEAAAGSAAVEVSYAEGCALLIRRAVAERTGGFDGDFFAYFEDADLGLRAKALGWTSLAVPAARVWHKVAGKDSGSGSPTACFYSARNSWRIVRRHASAAQRDTFHRCYPRRALGVLRDLIHARAAGNVPAARRDYAGKSALLLGAVAGFLGFKGPRDAGGWPVWERGLRIGLAAFVVLCLPLARLLPRRS